MAWRHMPSQRLQVTCLHHHGTHCGLKVFWQQAVLQDCRTLEPRQAEWQPLARTIMWRPFGCAVALTQTTALPASIPCSLPCFPVENYPLSTLCFAFQW